MARNVLGQPLQACSFDPITGFLRDGCCNTRADDFGTHVVCARMTAEFLEFSRACGNDLTTARPESRFKGLRPGDRWCLCVLRWAQAWEAGVAPPVVLASTHERALDHVTLQALQACALDASA
jgi:uncharacterized protein (DUF2237 family)